MNKPECVDVYRVHKDWCDFNILPMTAEMLDIKAVEDEALAKTTFDLTGKPLSQPRKGMNIVRQDNGTASKVLMR